MNMNFASQILTIYSSWNTEIMAICSNNNYDLLQQKFHLKIYERNSKRPKYDES